MANKKRISFTRMLVDCVLVIPSIINLINNLMTVLCLELKIIKRSIVSIIFLSIFMMFVFFSGWLCLLGLLLAYFLATLHWSLIFSFFILLMIHIGIWLICAIIASRIKQSAFFPETREKYREICRVCRNL